MGPEELAVGSQWEANGKSVRSQWDASEKSVGSQEAVLLLCECYASACASAYAHASACEITSAV